MKIFSRCMLLLLICNLILVSCSTEKPLTCTEESVTDLVVEIANDELYKTFLPDNLAGKSQAIYDESKDTAVAKEYEKIDYQGTGFAWGTIPVDEFLKFIEVSPTVSQINNKILQQVKDTNVTVTAIRVAGANPDIQKIGCQAQLAFSNGKSIPIEYTAQTTEDGQIWVEVDGL